ncbi:alpha/beta fold hydrolase [Bradyrhizobium sp. WSM 1738]|uniref:alpha/beta fold hydrolase n=1 Tax=Bradyrhizobium hereditatis TaxID=2821405 RepID=UPI001CE3782A|nr:alpha/beta fold hydrolase [Bradyrhizobium hereditatis]MCA6114465.1 alpha/beta fold hydrolase [Bradyrhizobium hereditatis]
MIYQTPGLIDYQEAGKGPTVVLVPGSCSTGAAWRPVIGHLHGQFRCVTTSLLGYGGTAERRTADDTDIAYEREILETVIRRTGGPVHLVGHSFGGLAVLAVALRGRVPLLSLTIAEAPAVDILKQTGEQQHYDTFRNMSRAYSAAFRRGEADAIARMIDFYGGAGTFAAWPQRVRDYAIETTPANLLDWESAYGLRLTPASLAAVTIPTLVVWGENSHPAVRRANDLLSRHIPRAERATIAGASHFMIATHPKQFADLTIRHFERAILALAAAQ